jgi:hypothetical protein
MFLSEKLLIILDEIIFGAEIFVKIESSTHNDPSTGSILKKDLKIYIYNQVIENIRIYKPN